MSVSEMFFSCVSRGPVVLSRYASVMGNFSDVTKVLLEKLDPKVNEKKSLNLPSSGPPNVIHYSTQDGIIYLCMTEQCYSRKSAFGFLDNIAKKFCTQFGGPENYDKLMPYAINAEFALVLCGEMKKADGARTSTPRLYNSGSSDTDHPDKITRLREEVDQVRDIMVSNIDSIVERGERLELLVDKTESLSSSSVTFKNTSRNLSRKMWWQNFRWTVFAVVVVLLIVYLIVGAACGGVSLPKCV